MSDAILTRTLFGALLAGGVSLAVARWMGPAGWMDHPKGRKTHAHPTPLTGGFALLGFVALCAALGVLTLPITPLQAGACGAMSLLGCVDDRIELRARTKAAIGFLAACVLAAEMALQIAATRGTISFAGISLSTGLAVTFPLLLLWYWSIPQAVNLVDGINGLSIGLLGLLVLASGVGISPQTALFWGGLLGVAALNFPRARHFLGDCGALGLGTLASILVMRRALQGDVALALWMTAYLVTDVSMVVLIRWVNRRPLGEGDRNHLHHWVLNRFNGRVWLATPILLAVAGLPMLRVLEGPLAHAAAGSGLALLMALAVRNAWLKTRRRKARRGAMVSLPVPQVSGQRVGAFHTELSDR